eukprot:GHVH01000228.1.p1 GENE.GHVH01000228.1~~GHVH01000228.1.p1  ORF type:complete len:267 (+),score=58.63 GHVH01000228.1:150-950(+)
MATVGRRHTTLTRRVNGIFRPHKQIEIGQYGLFTPPPSTRLPSDAPPPSSESSDLGDVPFKTVMVPVLDESGNPVMDKNGQPMMKKKKVALTAEETANAAGDIEAEKKRKEEEARLKAEEEARLAKLAAMREENLKVLRDITGGEDKADSTQAAQVARKMGFAPTAAETLRMHEMYGDTVDYDQILDFMTNHVEAGEPVDDLIQHFQHFDKERSGFLSRMHIKNLMTSYGEPLTDEEFNTLMEVCGITQDPVDYKAFVEELLKFEE